MTEKEDVVFIKHILESIEAIEEFSKDLSLEELYKNRLKKSAIIREIEIIGEAAKNISNDFTKKYPEIPWKNIIGTRDIMAHKYFGVNIEVVWKIVTQDIPQLKKQVLKIKE
jgi:uncharacterized protein with HEPN domain